MPFSTRPVPAADRARRLILAPETESIVAPTPILSAPMRVPRRVLAEPLGPWVDGRPLSDCWEVADLFAGGGGTASGAVDALAATGFPIRLRGVNHWEPAYQTYLRNFPFGEAFLTKVDAVAPEQIVTGRHLDLLLASPSCTGFSANVSGRSVSAEERALCWSIIPWLTVLRVRALLMENVPRFLRAGPLNADGTPDKAREGEEFELFVRTLEVKGFKVAWRILNAADYGDPQERKRLFLVAARDGIEPRFPMPTHGPAGSGRLPYRTARDILDFANKGADVTSRAARARLSPYTRARIEQGLEQFGGDCFLVPRKQGRNAFVRSVDRPTMTVVATRPYITLVQPERGRIFYRELTIPEYLRTQSLDDHQLVFDHPDDAKRLIGNAVPRRTARALVESVLGLREAQSAAA